MLPIPECMSMNPGDFMCDKCHRKASLIKSSGVKWCDYHTWEDYNRRPKPEWYVEHCFHECRPIAKGELGCDKCVAYDEKMKKIGEEINGIS